MNMTIENRIRKVLASKLTLYVTRKKRGPYVTINPDGKIIEHSTKKGALNHLLAEIRCMNSLRWMIAWRTTGTVKKKREWKS